MSKSSSNGAKRMLDQADIVRGIEETVALAKAQGVRLALAGGAALQRLGSDRFTADVDFVADGELRGLPRESELSFGGYGSHTASGVPVDLILRSDDYRPLYEEALECARVGEDGILAITPEYLAAMKLVARRPKDRADLDAMVAGRMFDVRKATRIVRRLLGAYAAEDFASFVQVARWRARTGRS